MAYKMELIEGVGPHFADLLASVKVKTTNDLLKHAAQDDGLKRLSERVEIPLVSLEAWAHRADLMRVNGIGPEFSELLDAAGVESVAELSMRSPENLLNLLSRVNGEKRLTRAVPTLRTLTKWVDRAQEMVQPPSRSMVSARPMVSRRDPTVHASPVHALPVHASPVSQAPVVHVVPRQPLVGSGAGVGHGSRPEVSGTGSSPYRPV